MDKAKRRRHEMAGWQVDGAAEFLGLTDAEGVLVELKLRLSDALKTRRTASCLSQEALARQLGSSQSRVAKMEAADRTVSLELIIRALLVLGATRRDLAAAVAVHHLGNAGRTAILAAPPAR